MDIKRDVTGLLRARNTLLWIVSREEARVEKAIVESAGAAKMQTRFWDCATGLSDASGKGLADIRDPNAMLAYIRETTTSPTVYVMRDLHAWIKDPVTQRNLRSLVRWLQTVPTSEGRAIVVLSPSSDVPPELTGHATLLDYPLPDREEIARIVDDTISSLPETLRAGALTGGRDAVIDASLGLSAQEAENCYAKSLVSSKPPRIDPATVNSEKKRIVAREKVLTWYDPDPGGLESIGGLENLKRWLVQRKLAFSAEARAYGLPAPKGIVLVGMSGCGKSLTAKCAATVFGVPLVRVDFGGLKSKYVGDSEANLRRALAQAEAMAPCVLWADEIEKAFAGATGEQGDGGVSADAMGAFLTWMQERKGSVFVIATANDVRALPPELLRKGRFDEVWWVDLPTTTEREAILKAALRGRPEVGIQVSQIARATSSFTGAEIAAIVPDALFTAFADGARALTTQDLLDAAATVVPLASTAKEKIQGLRDWAKGRARPASIPEATTETKGRALDL